MNNAALAAGASVTFTLNNSLVSINDNALLTIVDDFGVSAYSVRWVVWTAYISIMITNTTGGSLSQALRINFTLIKGATS